MKKVLYHGEYINIEDELEQGYLELDLLDPDVNNIMLENTLEMEAINIKSEERGNNKDE